MAPAMQSAEFLFAKRLASSEKGVRDRAVKKLRQYLSARTQSNTGAGPGPRHCARRGSRQWARVAAATGCAAELQIQAQHWPSSPRLVCVSGSLPWIVPAGGGVRERVEPVFQPRRNSGSGGRTRGNAVKHAGMYTSSGEKCRRKSLYRKPPVFCKMLTRGSQSGRRRKELSVPWAREIVNWRAGRVEMKLSLGAV